MMVRTHSEALAAFVTFGNVDELTFNRRTVQARHTADTWETDRLPDELVDDSRIVEHLYLPDDGDFHTVNWCAWTSDGDRHLMLSVNAIFVMNDAGATIDRIGEMR